MDSMLSVHNKDVTRDGKEFTKLPLAVTQAESYLYRQCEDLSWSHRISTPHRSETSGSAEGAVRRVKEGTSAVLLQSGLDEKWWAGSMECFCYLRNVQDLLANGKTPYERRFGESLGEAIILFGGMVQYHQISARDESRLQDFINWTRKSYLGSFLGVS